MTKTLLVTLLTFLFTLSSETHAAGRLRVVPQKPIKVEVKKTSTGFELYRNGTKYFIKGAGGSQYLDRVAAYGGNSIRTWGTKGAEQLLDSAEKYGLTVLMGLSLVPERHGFDYNNRAAVTKQLERVKSEVLKLKDHPALLAWGIGNELNLSYKNPAVWNAVNEVAEMIHKVDPNHPTTTVLAGLNKREVEYIKTQAPAVDILSVNTYGELATIPQKIKESGWDGPYMITEWGPTGHWEGLSTGWGAPIEESSSEKAAVYKSRYAYSIEKDKDNCLGSYVFLWGQKQERTPTWYGVFTENGEESEVVDVINYLWTGSYPENKAPHLYAFKLDEKKASDNIYLKAGAQTTASVLAADPDNDELTYKWEILPEPTKVGEGGDHEDKPAPIKWNYTNLTKGKVSLTIPQKTGKYRLFVYVKDGHNNVATANIPFYIE